jgi:hypothetical protein
MLVLRLLCTVDLGKKPGIVLHKDVVFSYLNLNQAEYSDKKHEINTKHVPKLNKLSISLKV